MLAPALQVFRAESRLTVYRSYYISPCGESNTNAAELCDFEDFPQFSPGDWFLTAENSVEFSSKGPDWTPLTTWEAPQHVGLIQICGFRLYAGNG